MSLQRRGFTLIELLAVIAIVGLLSALVFPVFVRVRENGRQTACLSNERQLGAAILQYAQDNDEGLPNRHTPIVASVNSGGSPWVYQVFPYIKNTTVFQCPDDPTSNDAAYLKKVHYIVDSYGINSNLNGEGGATAATPLVPLADLTAPAQTVLLFEVSGDTASPIPSPTPILACAASGNGGADPDTEKFGAAVALGCRLQSGSVLAGVRYATGNIGGRFHSLSTPRHGDGANYAACDGHVLWLAPERVSSGKNQPTGGEACDQDATTSGCGGKLSAAGTQVTKYGITFSIR